MVSSGQLLAGPHRTAIGTSAGCPDQPGPSPRCCPIRSQSPVTRCVFSCPVRYERLFLMAEPAGPQLS